jgi:hypothetical protein
MQGAIREYGLYATSILHEIGVAFAGNPEVEIADISGLRGGFGYTFGSNNFRRL